MPRYFIIAVFSLALVLAVSASAADNASDASDVVHGGGLICFSIQPPGIPSNKPTPHIPTTYQSCDQLCAARHAACTATTSNMNPMRACASASYDPASTLCRCCAVEH